MNSKNKHFCIFEVKEKKKETGNICHQNLGVESQPFHTEQKLASDNVVPASVIVCLKSQRRK